MNRLKVCQFAECARVKVEMQNFCWFDQNEPVKSLSVPKRHMCKLLAGSIKMNQLKVCQFERCTCAKVEVQTYCCFVRNQQTKAVHFHSSCVNEYSRKPAVPLQGGST